MLSERTASGLSAAAQPVRTMRYRRADACGLGSAACSQPWRWLPCEPSPHFRGAPALFCQRRTPARSDSTITTVQSHDDDYHAHGRVPGGRFDDDRAPRAPGLCRPPPAVLLGPEGMGLSDVERRRADALAELGYVALAFDLHGGRYLGDPEEMLARCMPLLADPNRMRGIGHAALDVLRAEPRTDPDRIAAVGYGTGGAIGLELGRGGVSLRAIGTVNALTTGRPGEAARIRCPVWAGVGSEDPIMPPAQRDAFTAEMQAAGVDWRLVVYGGALHAFHHPPVDHPVVPGVGYHPRHAQRAWRDVVDLLAECLPVTE